MTETDFQIFRTAGFVVAVALAVTLERVSPHSPIRGSWRVNGGLWGVNLLVIGVVCGACACIAARWANARGAGLLNLAGAPLVVAIPATILGLDLVSYLWHRANHRIAFLWRFHRVHHSDATFTASTALRFHPGELVLSFPLRLAAIVALGAPVEAVVVFEVVFSVANLLEHGNIDAPLSLEQGLARVVVTPALHRLHHSAAVSERDSNFGTIFTWWDRALSSYRPSTSNVRVTTGLADTPAPASVAQALALGVDGVGVRS